jgi:hypothetical protein
VPHLVSFEGGLNWRKAGSGSSARVAGRFDSLIS